MRAIYLRAGTLVASAAAILFCFGATPADAISSVINISTRMVVETGDNVLIAGFIINGTGQKEIMVRAIGPSLPVPGALSDPTLELHDATGAIIATNDNWRSSQQAAIIASGLAPADDRDSALIRTLTPGAYTVVDRRRFGGSVRSRYRDAGGAAGQHLHSGPCPHWRQHHDRRVHCARRRD